MEQKANNSKFIISIPLFICAALAIGILIGATMFGSNQKIKKMYEGYNKLREILTYIDQDYVDTVNTEELIDYSIEKMLEKLDPHTTYIPVKDVQLANAQLEGDFDGIGIEFNIFKDTIYVVAPLSGGPSETVGLQSGDKIITVDGKKVAGIGIDNAQVFKYLRGKKGTEVILEVKRKGKKELLSYTITRDKIPSYSVDVSYMIDKQTGFIKVNRFAANTYKEFREALEMLVGEGMKRLIIDLRDNPGGYMDRAVNMADELLGGDPKIVYTDGKGTKYDTEARAKIKGIFESGAVIVLLNEGSASASEIFAGALQDNDRALIVGRRSFGKGLVQMPIDLSDGSELRLTISRYYTPSGRSIQKPYSSSEKDGKETYSKELMDRYKNGEFFSADSIKFDKSLQYTTAKGRTVYGGGGIMPDYFIPLDTNQDVKYLNKLYNENIIREFALNYFNDNKESLSKMKYEDFSRNFIVSDDMLKVVVNMADKAKISFNQTEFENSKPMIKSHIKAWIAKGVWQNKGFYPIWFENDEIFQKALKLFDKAEKLENGDF